MQKILLLTLLTLASALSLADDLQVTETTISKTEITKTETLPGRQMELGVSLGSPALVNPGIGFWGDSDIPFVVRARGNYIGFGGGASTSFGLVVARTPGWRHFVGVGSEFVAGLDPFMGFQGYWVGGGPRYGFNYRGLVLETGVSIGGGQVNWLGFFPGTAWAILPSLSIGYAFNIDV